MQDMVTRAYLLVILGLSIISCHMDKRLNFCPSNNPYKASMEIDTFLFYDVVYLDNKNRTYFNGYDTINKINYRVEWGKFRPEPDYGGEFLEYDTTSTRKTLIHKLHGKYKLYNIFLNTISNRLFVTAIHDHIGLPVIVFRSHFTSDTLDLKVETMIHNGQALKQEDLDRHFDFVRSIDITRSCLQK
jgi:hypothetical protein